jgi:hypothetical protein
MAFGTDVDREIADAAAGAYREMAHWLPFDAVELGSVFSPDELAELHAFRAELAQAADDNARKAAAVARYSGLVLKLLRLARVVA